MISFAKNGRSSSHGHSVGRPARLYLWVAAAIFLLQGFLIVGGICRTLVFMSDKLEAGLPASYWWAVVGVRACAWLVLVPLIAAIIVDRRSSIWQLALLHLGLLTVAVLVSGHFLHRLAHIQTDQLTHLVDTKKSIETNKFDGVPGTNSDNKKPIPIAATEDYSKKSYEGVTFHNSYGLGYWIGEFTVIFTAYLIMNAVGYAVLYFRMIECRTRQAEQLRIALTQLHHESLCNRLTPHFLLSPAVRGFSSVSRSDSAGLS